MEFRITNVPYRQTGYFSKIITDYLDENKALQPFYDHAVSIEGIKSAIESRAECPVNRTVLFEELKAQYALVDESPRVTENLEKLRGDRCFTVCTAHQPAIFTGTLYFIYKILHTIRLAEYLTIQMPSLQFVPIYYMGSEDADLNELGHIYLDHQKVNWDTHQLGAVGKMTTIGLEKIIDRIEGQFSMQAYGQELVALLKDCYLQSDNVQTGTFKLVHALFEQFGLVVLIPDNVRLKKLMIPAFREELFAQLNSVVIEETIRKLSQDYKVQANPREINLFYLKDNVRQRIVSDGTKFQVAGTSIEFSKSEIEIELESHPERFSPNVFLRGLFQETILPNIAFIGGGGELAYWFELKTLFEKNNVPFPVLILRNSFLIIERKWDVKLLRLGLHPESLFKSAEELVNDYVKLKAVNKLNLGQEKNTLDVYYEKLKAICGSIDPSLSDHVQGLKIKSLKRLDQLEKKMLKAEKRKFSDDCRQIQAIKEQLFPFHHLQERIENFMPYYAIWGKPFIAALYEHSSSLKNEFTIMEEI